MTDRQQTDIGNAPKAGPTPQSGSVKEFKELLSRYFNTVWEEAMTDPLHSDDAPRKALESELVALFTPRSSAAVDVLVERQRQMDVEGWTSAHDDEHQSGEMIRAAVFYATNLLPGSTVRQTKYTLISATNTNIAEWPQFWDQRWFKPTEPRRDLVKAAALILAEIEKIDRAQAKQVE